MSDDEVVVGPEGADAAVIWMHGLGADGHDFAGMVPALGRPGVKFVFPHAPVRPVTVNGGWQMRAWYDIKQLHQGPEREEAAHIREQGERLAARIDDLRVDGIDASRILVAGFSQGGAMASWVALRYPARLAGLLLLSTYEVLPHELRREASDANRELPALVCHGRDDEVVDPRRGDALAEMLKKEPGRLVRQETFRIGHGVSDDEVAVIASWLKRRLP